MTRSPRWSFPAIRGRTASVYIRVSHGGFIVPDTLLDGDLELS